MQKRLVLCFVLVSTFIWASCADTETKVGTERGLLTSTAGSAEPQLDVGWTLAFPKAIP